MWQRKQTLFLSLSILCLIAMMFFPIWQDRPDAYERALFPLYEVDKSSGAAMYLYFPYALSATLAIAAATAAFISIRRYENRLVQLKIGLLNALLMGGAVVLGIVFAGRMMREYQTAGAYGFSLYFPMAAMIFNFIANIFIRRDERRVRDADRLR